MTAAAYATAPWSVFMKLTRTVIHVPNHDAEITKDRGKGTGTETCLNCKHSYPVDANSFFVNQVSILRQSRSLYRW